MKASNIFVLLLAAGFLQACGSKAIDSDNFVVKDQIKDNLLAFPLLRIENQKVLARYDFTNHKTDRLVSMSIDMDLEDVSSDQDIFVIEDENDKRVTVFSSLQGKILLQKRFEVPGKRIGAVRLSPDKSRFAFTWRPNGSDVDDSISVTHIKDGTSRTYAATTKQEVTDLNWSSDGHFIFTATYDPKAFATKWTKTDIRSLARVDVSELPADHFQPYYARKANSCDFDLDYSTEGTGSTKNVSSIDKVEPAARTEIIKFTTGLEVYPHGKNFAIWETASCKTALLRVNRDLYAIDIENKKLSEILTDFVGTAEGIPTKIP